MRPVFLVLLCITGAATDPDDVHELTNGTVTSLNHLFNTDEVYNVTVVYEAGSGVSIQSIASSLSDTFAHIKHMLRDSVALADNLYRSETISGSCLDEHANEYYCQSHLSTCTRTVADFESSCLFTRNVSGNSCAIHIPVDIHTDHANVQRFIQWSSGLGDHFANQSMDMPFGVTHQYFGSRDGVLRFYPSSKWSLLNTCYRCPVPPADTFDARQRPWYTNTVSGSKFVVILIDMSGSMTRSRLVLALLTAKQILDSLTPNDYFLVIKVAGDDSSGPLNCFSKRTRASSENILIVTEVLLNQVGGTGGRANFNSGIMQAFEVLNGSSECHKIVMVITDKDVDGQQLSQAIEDHKLLIQQIRVFIFAVGPGRNNHLEWIACDNGGRIYEVRGYNDILNHTQTFVSNLRSLTPPLFMDDVFWSHYRDVSGDLVLTGSLPLITNNTADEIGEFVGVMGIDVDVSNVIQHELQKYNVCATGYGFMTDNNGQLVAHPSIDIDYIKKNLSSDDLISLDISYFEHAQDIELLRRAMVNRETGNLTMPVWLPVDVRRRYHLKNITYHFAPVENTPFSVAVALPDSEPPGMCIYTSMPEETSNDVGIPNTLLDDSSSARNSDTFAGYSNESLYKYLSHALDGDEVFSLYADSLGVVAIKNLPHSDVSSVLSTSFDAVDTVLDQLLSTSDDAGGHNESFYLLDSSGFVVWTSDAEQLQVRGHRFAKLQPLVFEDMVNNSVFIRKLFMGHEPKPCGAYSMPHSFTTACLDSAASSMHKNFFFLSLMKFGLWLITDGLRMIALTICNSVLGCIGSICHLLSLSVGHAQTTGSETGNSCCDCLVNLCLDVVTAIQLDPKFIHHISNQITCPDDTGTAISYAAKKVNSTNLVLVKVHGNCSKQDNDSARNLQSFLPCAQCIRSCTCIDSVHQDADLCSHHRQSIEQTCHTIEQHKFTYCSEIPT